MSMAEKHKQRSDGRFVAKYKGLYFYGATQEEAVRKRDNFRYENEHGISEIRNVTVSQYAAEWLPVAKASMSDKCYNDYAVQLEALTEVCGQKYMNAVTPNDLLKVWKHYLDYSDSTIHRAQMLYRALFESGIENGVCRSNPVKKESAKPHKGTTGTHRNITDEERELILKVEHRCQLPALIMLYGGLRRGEVFALTGSDIYDGYIHINKAVRFEGNRPVIDTPKTDAGVREVPVFGPILTHLEGIAEDDLIFPTAHNKMMTDTAFRRAWDSYLHALSLAAGHPVSIRPHDLRHSFCVMLRDAGVDIKLAMQWMGHADEKMILHIYDHVTAARVRSAITAVNDQIGRVSNGCQVVSIERRKANKKRPPAKEA